jgi:hypothetical protein
MESDRLVLWCLLLSHVLLGSFWEMVPITCCVRALDLVDALIIILARQGEGQWRVEFVNKALHKFLGLEQYEQVELIDYFLDNIKTQYSALSGYIVLRGKDGKGIIFLTMLLLLQF